MVEEDKLEAQRSKRFKMIERKKEICDCHSCSQKTQNVKDFKESIDETLCLLLNRSEDDTAKKPKGMTLFGTSKMARSMSLRNPMRRASTVVSSSSRKWRERNMSSPEVNVPREVKQRLWCRSVKDRIKDSENNTPTGHNSIESPTSPIKSRLKSNDFLSAAQASGISDLKSKLESLVI